jgi:angiomotin like 1
LSISHVILNSRLEAECSKLEQQNIESNARVGQEKLRFLDDHTAQRKVSDLQTRLKLVENRLVEKDAIIRALQGQKCKHFK